MRSTNRLIVSMLVVAALAVAGAVGAGLIVAADRRAEWDNGSPFPYFWLGLLIFAVPAIAWAGRRDVRLLPDGWTVVTKDQSLSAQWEHTILVTDEGYEVLTLGAGVSAPAAAAAS